MTTAILLALLVPVQPQVSVSGGIQVEAHVPTIQFEAAPALMVVTPGVMVVPGHDREVFFTEGFYWYNLSGAWFRTRSHRGGWVRVAFAQVPQPIIRLPRGKYRNFHGGRLYRRAAPVARPRPVRAVVKKRALARHPAKKARVAGRAAAKAKKKPHAARAANKKSRAAVKTQKARSGKKKARSARAARPSKARHARSTRSRKVRSARGAKLDRRRRH